jgi:hypothetical protein
MQPLLVIPEFREAEYPEPRSRGKGRSPWPWVPGLARSIQPTASAGVIGKMDCGDNRRNDTVCLGELLQRWHEFRRLLPRTCSQPAMRHSIRRGMVAALRAPCYARIRRSKGAGGSAAGLSRTNVRLLGEAATVH